MALHKDLTGSDLHEPKGITGATDGQVYIADGSNSGSWQDLVIPSGNFLITYAFFDASGTWSKPSNLIGIEAILCGGGGGNTGDGSNTSFASRSANGGKARNSTRLGGTGGTGDVAFQGASGVTTVDGVYAISSFPIQTPIPYGAGCLSTGGGGGGGGGEVTVSWIAASSLSSTETVTVASAGPGGTNTRAGAVYIKQYIKAT